MGHKIINLADAQPGMRVVADVCGLTDGDVLLAAGEVLSEAALATLARHGVTRIDVAEALSQEERALRITEIDRRLDVLFRHAGSDPLLGKLRETVQKYRVEGL